MVGKEKKGRTLPTRPIRGNEPNQGRSEPNAEIAKDLQGEISFVSLQLEIVQKNQTPLVELERRTEKTDAH